MLLTSHLSPNSFVAERKNTKSKMNSSVIPWMSPPVMHNPMFTGPRQNSPVDSLEDDFAALFGKDFGNGLSSPRTNSPFSPALIDNYNISSFLSNSVYPCFEMEQPTILQQGPASYSPLPDMINFPVDQDSSAPIPLNFWNSEIIHQLQVNQPLQWNLEEASVEGEVVMGQGAADKVDGEEEGPEPIKTEPAKKKARIRPPSQTHDHIIAERRRREQLSQLFVALSALVPGLKKMDKSSVLEFAIKYLKQLKERVHTLEEKAEKNPMESVMVIKKSHIIMKDECSSNKQTSTTLEEEEEEEQALPEIEARSCDNHMLLKVHCEKQKGVLAKLVSKIESMDMIVINTNATPFGNITLDITIIAEIEKGFKLTMKEVVTAVREAIEP